MQFKAAHTPRARHAGFRFHQLAVAVAQELRERPAAVLRYPIAVAQNGASAGDLRDEIGHEAPPEALASAGGLL